MFPENVVDGEVGCQKIFRTNIGKASNIFRPE
jgi:hypothetical protein